MGRYNRRKDSNQNDIVEALEQAGCAVADMSTAGDGFTDLLVTRAGVHYLVEIKTDSGKLNPLQEAFHVKHAPVHTVRTVAEAFQAVGLLR